MIIFDYPDEESYWKHKLSNENFWLNEHPISRTHKKRKAKCEKKLEEISREVLINDRIIKLF